MPHRKKTVTPKPEVEWEPRAQYEMHYVPEFPLSVLRYLDLWAKDELNRPWRAALRDDIKERGMRTPLIVWNHHMGSMEFQYLSKKPYILMNGRNRIWALRDLGYTHAPAIVSGDCEYPSTKLTSVEDIMRYWPDGRLVVAREGIKVYGKTDPTRYEYPA